MTCEALIDVCHGLGVLHHLEAWVRTWAAEWDRRRAGGEPSRMCGRPTGYRTVWTCSGCVEGEGAGDRTRAEAGVA